MKKQLIIFTIISFSILLLSCKTVEPVDPIDIITNSNKAVVAKVVTKDNHSYLEVNGKAHLSYGVHITSFTQIDNYLQKAADLGFKTVYCYVRWDQVELSHGVYDFDNLIRAYLNAAYKYDLYIELVWMGSSMNGGPCAPSYIMDDQITYPRIAKPGESWQRTMDFTNTNIVKKEQEVLKAMMAYIGRVDIRKKIISIATSAEPDNWSFTGTAWQGQKDAVINNMLSPLGKTLQACDHRIGVKTWLAAEWQDIDDVLSTGGYDMVGFDPYSTNSATMKAAIDRVMLNNSLSNVFEATESGGHFDAYINSIITAFNEGFGYYVYELRTYTFRNYDYGIFRPTTEAANEWIERDGSQIIAYDPNGKASGKESNTAEIRLFNKMIYKADQKIAACPKDKSIGFNLGNTISATETLNIVGKSIQFSTTNNGCALAIIDTVDNSIVVLPARGDINIKYISPAKTITISVGAYDASNKWIEQSKQDISSDNMNIKTWEVVKIPFFI